MNNPNVVGRNQGKQPNRGTNRSSKKARGYTITVAVVGVLFVTFFLLTFVSQLVNRFYKPLRTEFALYYEDVDSVLFKGVFIRNERQITPDGFAGFVNNPSYGVVSYTNRCGAKLSIDSVIAVVYSDELQIANRKKIEQLQEQIDALVDSERFIGMQSEGEVQSDAQIGAFAELLADSHLQILKSISEGDYEKASSYKNEYLSLRGKIDASRKTAEEIVSGTGLEERIDQLQHQKRQLEGTLRSSLQEVRTSEPGYFVNNADGYESVLTFDNALDVSGEFIRSVIDNPTLSVNPNVAGKLIDGYRWRMAAIVPTDRTMGIFVGSSVNLRIGTYSRTVSAEVKVSNVLGDGTTLLVFECELLAEEFVTKRVSSVRLLLDDYSGIRIPQSAVRFDEEGVRGVYIRNGSVLEFRKINMLRSEEDFVIVENTERPGYLRIYDEVVVSGKNLYDGKVV